MTRDDIHHLAAPYALDAVDDEERAFVEAHFESCEVCSADIAHYCETAAALAATTDAPPPAGLRNSVLDAIDQTRQDSPIASMGPTAVPTPRAVGSVGSLGDEPSVGSAPAPATQGRFTRFNRRVLATAAGIVALAAAGVGLVISLGGSDTSTPTEVVLEAPDAEAVALEQGPGNLRVAWSAERGEVAVIGKDIPPVDASMTYELWVIDETGPQRSLLFTPDEDGAIDVAGALTSSPLAFAVTVEPAGGSDEPTSDIVWIREL